MGLRYRNGDDSARTRVFQSFLDSPRDPEVEPTPCIDYDGVKMSEAMVEARRPDRER